jgi:predicted nucleic-acid-binding protein
MDKPVSQERTGWRDRALSLRHRAWGWNCPAVDIDFVMLEYDMGFPVALVEYKHEYAQLVSLSHPSYKAMADLCDRADIVFFCVRYSLDLTSFKVIPLNAKAKVYLSDRAVMTEVEYVAFLYKMRDREIPESVIDALMIPPKLYQLERELELEDALNKEKKRCAELLKLLERERKKKEEVSLALKDANDSIEFWLNLSPKEFDEIVNADW